MIVRVTRPFGVTVGMKGKCVGRGDGNTMQRCVIEITQDVFDGSPMNGGGAVHKL
jgi:hypothetical protein